MIPPPERVSINPFRLSDCHCGLVNAFYRGHDQGPSTRRLTDRALA